MLCIRSGGDLFLACCPLPWPEMNLHCGTSSGLGTAPFQVQRQVNELLTNIRKSSSLSIVYFWALFLLINQTGLGRRTSRNMFFAVLVCNIRNAGVQGITTSGSISIWSTAPPKDRNERTLKCARAFTAWFQGMPRFSMLKRQSTDLWTSIEMKSRVLELQILLTILHTRWLRVKKVSTNCITRFCISFEPSRFQGTKVPDFRNFFLRYRISGCLRKPGVHSFSGLWSSRNLVTCVFIARAAWNSKFRASRSSSCKHHQCLSKKCSCSWRCLQCCDRGVIKYPMACNWPCWRVIRFLPDTRLSRRL